MLLIDTTLWESDHIIKLCSGSQSQWNSDDSSLITKCILEKIKSLLMEVNDNYSNMILIIDLSKGCFPPWIQALNIAKFFVCMKKLITKSLAFTIIYTVTEQQDLWINRILTIYTPARPLHVVHSKKEIKSRIEKYRNLIVCE